MTSAKSLLNFYFDPNQFAADARYIISRKTRESIEKVTEALADIAAKNQGNKREPSDIGEIYQTFMALAPKGIEVLKQEFDTLYKVRKLVRSLAYPKENPKLSILSSAFLPLALQIINKYWRDGMLGGLFRTLLQNWSYPGIERLRRFVGEKINRYSGNNQTLLVLKHKAPFYIEDQGTISLGLNLIQNQKKLSEVWQYLDLPDSMKGYEYFSTVGEAFTSLVMRKQQFEQYIPDILEFLKQHRTLDTSKKCLCKIILKLQNGDHSELRERIKVSTLELIGDPIRDDKWLPWAGANETDKSDLKKAQTILNQWLTQQFIVIFFEKLTMDEDRKAFWLHYSRHISNFKIYGHRQDRVQLSGDYRIKEEYLKTHFGFIKNAERSQRAFVMVVKDYVFVEFSECGGAFYAYRKTNPICPDILQDSLSIHALRHSKNRKPLTSIQNEGRLSHTAGWKCSLSRWLKTHLEI
ncbi:MAG TPA: EH signature domain-containing protein [Candidatus Limnocylindrales bacterium]|nr:EH signature domain-containing protein [Candidatus Limnocylindrales bacterium]